VLSVAGPFSATANAMMNGSIDAGAHYLDVTGEIDVFELGFSLSSRAADRGVMVLPGVGFDVVPSDCLVAHAVKRAGSARFLRLAIAGAGTASRGTAKTGVESIGAGTRVRRGGEIVSLPAGSLTHRFDFGRGLEPCVALSLGDIVTAYHSTGAPDIEVYFKAAGPIVQLVNASRRFGRLLATRPAQALLKAVINRQPDGPSDAERERNESVLVAEVEDAEGGVTRARLHTPSGYKLTYLAAVEIARRVLQGEVKPGYQTPATAFGADFILTLPACVREDL